MSPRGRRILRSSAIAAAVIATGAVLLGLWLARDCSDGFEARRGVIASAVVQEVVESDGHVEEHLVLHSTSGLRVELAVKRPIGEAPKGGRPVALLLGGLETGRRALRFVPDTRGAIAVALSYPYEGPKKPKGLAAATAAPAIRAALRDTAPAIRSPASKSEIVLHAARCNTEA